MTNPYRELLQSQVKDTNTRLRAAQATEAAQSAATTQLTPAIATFDKNIAPAALTVAGILLSWETPPNHLTAAAAPTRLTREGLFKASATADVGCPAQSRQVVTLCPSGCAERTDMSKIRRSSAGFEGTPWCSCDYSALSRSP